MISKAFDVAIVGGGPAGATAAHELAGTGLRVALIDRDGRIKPCGGAVPPILLREYGVPESLLEAKVTSARMIAPSETAVDMPIGGFVGMVDRGVFDPWLRRRAADAGADLITGEFKGLKRHSNGTIRIDYELRNGSRELRSLTTRLVIGADGAASRVRQLAGVREQRMKHVFAYHEIVRSPTAATARFDPQRCDVYYQSPVSPDFYGWVFPHGECTSVGAGSAVKGFSLRNRRPRRMREVSGLDRQRSRSDRRRTAAASATEALGQRPRHVVVIGDAAGAVAPSSGEGIYYAMCSGRFAANTAREFLATGNARVLRKVRRQFMSHHRLVFFILGIMQYYWYGSDKRREKFVDICRDPDVQKLTWDAYMNKKLVRAKPAGARPNFRQGPGAPRRVQSEMTTMARSLRAGPVLTAGAAALFVALLGALMTDIGPWYAALEKPPWQPPDYLFGPAWTTIFALTAIAGAMAWTASETVAKKQNLIILFALNGTLNVVWSLLFFRLRRPDLALWEVSLLWASIVLLIYACARRNKLAALLLVPYLAWVSFAAVLNAEVVRLNPHLFGS